MVHTAIGKLTFLTPPALYSKRRHIREQCIYKCSSCRHSLPQDPYHGTIMLHALLNTLVSKAFKRERGHKLEDFKRSSSFTALKLRSWKRKLNSFLQRLKAKKDINELVFENKGLEEDMGSHVHSALHRNYHSPDHQKGHECD